MNPVSTPNLTAFRERWPKTRIGILRLLWPTIWECLEGGHTLRDIHAMLKLDGIDMAYSTLCWAVAGLRQNDVPQTTARKKHVDLPTAARRPGEAPEVPAGPDPLLNLRRLTERRPGFEYTGALPDEELFGPK
jgi:hypothetical protein